VLPTSVLRSSTLRFALTCISLFGTVVFILFGYVYWSTASFVRARSDRIIASEYAVLRQAYDRGGGAAVIRRIRQRVAEQGPNEAVYLLTDASFNPIAGNLYVWPQLVEDGEGYCNFTMPAGRFQGEPPQIRARYDTLPNSYHLLVGRNIDDLNRFVRTIAIGIVGAIVLMFTLAAAASMAVSRRTVGRIEAINATCRDIMRSGLNKRIPVRGTKDEWDHLSENLNSMLDRIEALMQGIRQVSDNIAHDLRTPLSRMRGRLEQASKQRLDTDESQLLVCDTIAELDGVLALFSSILRIARLEAHEGAAAFHTVDLREIADQIAELFDAAAEEKGGHVKLIAAEPAPVSGDRDLLFDAIANLVDNAVKHGGDNGQVTIEVTHGADGPRLAVSDRGPGIPADEQKNVLKRFCRLERSRSTPGNGLGLSLVAAVAQLHGAQIAMASNEPGLCIELRFLPTKIMPYATPRQRTLAR
jgi:signal transduction histidine kinase